MRQFWRRKDAEPADLNAFHLSPEEFDRRAAIGTFLGASGLAGIWVTGDHLFGRGQTLLDRGQGLNESFEATVTVVAPIIETAIRQIDVVKSACGDVAPKLEDVDLVGLRDALVAIAAFLPKPKNPSENPSSTTTILLPGALSPQAVAAPPTSNP